MAEGKTEKEVGYIKIDMSKLVRFELADNNHGDTVC